MFDIEIGVEFESLQVLRQIALSTAALKPKRRHSDKPK